jgi:hypothetical protein
VFFESNQGLNKDESDMIADNSSNQNGSDGLSTRDSGSNKGQDS